MPKGFCKVCGLWLNLHQDGKCHTDHYGQPEGGAFVQGAATPEEVARVKGLGATNLVDVQFPEQTGEYADAKRREAEESEARAANEPLLGKLTAEGRRNEEQQGGAIDRTGPEDIEEASQAALANVAGLRRDVDEMAEPPSVSEVDPLQAGDADLKSAVRTDNKDEDDPTPRRGARVPAEAGGAANATRATTPKGGK